MAISRAEQEAFAVQFGSNVRRIRHRVGLSQETLAAASRLHRTEIGLIEKGQRSPRISTLLQLAGSLEVPPGDLIAGIEWQPNWANPRLGGFYIADQRVVETRPRLWDGGP